jgi:two-component system, NtrC family, response regulator AtoC
MRKKDESSTLRKVAAIVDHEQRVSLLVYSQDGCQMVPLTPGRSIVIGRIRPADVPIADMSLSRRHARFELVNDEVWVEDLQSTNGSCVNGRRVERCKVKPGDKIALGAVTVSVDVMTPVESQLQGLDSHDRFLSHLESEVTQARFFGRKLALLMIRGTGEHVSSWLSRIRAPLRPVDRVGLYGPSAVLVYLAAAGRDEAMELARAISRGQRRGELTLTCGAAIFPDTAASAEELIEVARMASQQTSPRAPVQCPQGAPLLEERDAQVVVHSPAMRALFETVQRLAHSAIPVLIYGETGTGKEVVARAIHDTGERRRKPLRCINCGAIPRELIESALFGHERGAFTGADKQAKGVFEEADGGTVLLDEIGELSQPAQAALLRVLETKRISRVGSSKEIEVDVRILAATHRDLDAMCEASTFRLDLLYRLNTMTLKIPPLRDRPEEILPLAEIFVEQANRANSSRVKGISPAAIALLRQYSWPGNVRELRNVIERAVLVARGEMIAVDDLTERLRMLGRGSSTNTSEIATLAREQIVDEEQSPSGEDLDFRDRVRMFEVELILDALRASDWNQTEAARRLRIPLRTLVHKIRVYDLRR